MRYQQNAPVWILHLNSNPILLSDCNHPSSDMPQLHLHLAGSQIQIFQEHCSMSKWLGYQVGRVRLFHHASNSIASFIRKRQKACFEHLPYQKDSDEFMFFHFDVMTLKSCCCFRLFLWKNIHGFLLCHLGVTSFVEFVEDRRVSPYLWGQHRWVVGRSSLYLWKQRRRKTSNNNVARRGRSNIFCTLFGRS